MKKRKKGMIPNTNNNKRKDKKMYKWKELKEQKRISLSQAQIHNQDF